MALGPLGNLHFVSQNAALASTQASNELGKESFASLANMAEFQSKEKLIAKLEKVAQSNEVQKEIKEKAEEEKKKKKNQADLAQAKEEDETQTELEPSKNSRLLDLSI